jgi:hypothetical protein
MPPQLRTLLLLNQQLLDLDLAQRMIDSGRKTWPRHQRVQLELDREQADLDAKRHHILMIQYMIASSN